MSSRSVLLIGLDPRAIQGFDPVPVEAAIAMGQARFDAEGFEADLCLVAPDETARAQIIEALTRKPYACVVVGGGIRKHEELLELFEVVINLIRRHAPQAAIAFNTNPVTSVDAAKRWLS